MYKNKLIEIRNADDNIVDICRDVDEVCNLIGISAPYVYRKVKDGLYFHNRQYGEIRLTLYDYFRDYVGGRLYEEMGDLSAYFTHIRIYTYNVPYRKKGEKRVNWYYDGTWENLPSECENETITRMTYNGGILRIWITAPYRRYR